MKVRQRGSGWSIKLVFNLYRLFGYKFIYYLMYPVSYFYYLKAKNVRNALVIYYKHIGKEFTPSVHHEHLRHFAICMCDRFVSVVSPEEYTFIADDIKKIENELKKGGLLLCSHFGGWASIANCLDNWDIQVNIIMQEVLIQSIKSIEETLETKKQPKIKIIDIAKEDIGVSIEIARALSNDEIVAMMADRGVSEKSKKGIEFFGDTGYFNKNPFEIAYKTQKPLNAIFINYVKPQTYMIDHIKIDINYNEKKDIEVERCMKIYAKRFETNIKKYPQDWFNFYNFWEK
ncbi:lysophospholipid acyltransferase family protein [Sulfurospirillum arcachonense]|uniref:lysophospholipid acyltransferase family protein n=1 Tax=Sulfurospirillum arcachonense TaxID=57666 RepID=UPI00046AA397|nr:lysophospholipid acyltransferase family protein [Sulfurospirillum arcachonense]